MHADWVMVGAFTPTDDPEKPDLCMYVIPRDEVNVIDTWRVAGMVGPAATTSRWMTSSCRAIVSRALPTCATARARAPIFHDSPTYKMPMMPVLGLTRPRSGSRRRPQGRGPVQGAAGGTYRIRNR